MAPPFIDHNHSYDVSTTTLREHIEYDILPYTSQVDDIWKYPLRKEYCSTMTNSKFSDPQLFESELISLEGLDENFDIVSKIDYGPTKQIKVRLVRTSYKPIIVLD